MPVVQYPSRMEPGSLVAVVLTDVAFDFDLSNQIDYGFPDPEPDSYAGAVEPWIDYAVLTYDSSADYAFCNPNEEDDSVFEFSFEPQIPLPVVLTDVVFDFDQVQNVNDVDDPVFDFSFDPWDLSVVTIGQYPTDYDTDQPTNPEDDPIEIYSFELWDLAIVTLGQYPTEYDTDQPVNPEDDPIEVYQFDPWTSVVGLAIVWDSSADYDTTQTPNDEDDPITEWEWSPWIDHDVDFIQDTDFVDLSQSVNDEDDPVFEFSFDFWSATPTNIVDAPNFSDPSLEVNDPDDSVFDFYFDPWINPDDFPLVYDPSFDSDQVQNVNQEDDPIFEFYFESWSAIPVAMSGINQEFDYTNQVDYGFPDPEFDSYAVSMEPWFVVPIILTYDTSAGDFDYDGPVDWDFSGLDQPLGSKYTESWLPSTVPDAPLVAEVVYITSTCPLPNAKKGVAYSYQFAAAGTTGPFIWSIVSGALQEGLSMSSSGLISGTPTVGGAVQIVVHVEKAL